MLLQYPSVHIKCMGRNWESHHGGHTFSFVSSRCKRESLETSSNTVPSECIEVEKKMIAQIINSKVDFRLDWETDKKFSRRSGYS